MDAAALFETVQDAVFRPEKAWQKVISKDDRWTNLLLRTALPIALTFMLLSIVVAIIFTPAMRHNPGGLLIMLPISLVVGGVAYTLSLLLSGWLADVLTKIFGGRENFDRSVSMMFFTGIPVMIGGVFKTIPYIGSAISMLFGIYSLYLFWKAIPIFLKISSENRWKFFLSYMLVVIFTAYFISYLIFNGTQSPL